MPRVVHYTTKGYLSRYVSNLTGMSIADAIDYLSNFANVQVFQIGDITYLNADCPHGKVHCKFG